VFSDVADRMLFAALALRALRYVFVTAASANDHACVELGANLEERAASDHDVS